MFGCISYNSILLYYIVLRRQTSDSIMSNVSIIYIVQRIQPSYSKRYRILQLKNRKAHRFFVRPVNIPTPS